MLPKLEYKPRVLGLVEIEKEIFLAKDDKIASAYVHLPHKRLMQSPLMTSIPNNVMPSRAALHIRSITDRNSKLNTLTPL